MIFNDPLMAFNGYFGQVKSFGAIAINGEALSVNAIFQNFGTVPCIRSRLIIHILWWPQGEVSNMHGLMSLPSAGDCT